MEFLIDATDKKEVGKEAANIEAELKKLIDNIPWLNTYEKKCLSDDSFDNYRWTVASHIMRLYALLNKNNENR
ncbi:MAG: hypothetical protein PHV82_17515 [Victivallaceae bacterium]|nr:hypothetical protein [Victivallaceae bacterium]